MARKGAPIPGAPFSFDLTFGGRKTFHNMDKVKVITGEQPFKVTARTFAVSSSAEGYTPAYSVDGVNFTNHDKSCPAGEVALFTVIPNNIWWKLVGNQSEVTVIV